MMEEQIHFKEDTAKPENRTNLSLLSILQIEEIRNFIFDKLHIKNDCLIYPCPNLVKEEFAISLRPDFVIKNFIGEENGYIEVELGPENDAQIRRYKSEKKCPVFSIVGKKSYTPSDLSLEEIYNYIMTIKTKYQNTQQSVSLKLFCVLVKFYVIEGNFKTTSSRACLSDKMLSTSLIEKVFSSFCRESIIQAENKALPGKIKLDTISENGFSLRVYSRKSSSNSISLMSRSGGREIIYFPSLKKLEEYIPYRKEICASYAKLVAELGDKDILNMSKTEKAHLPLKVVEDNFDKFAVLIKNLW